MKTRRVLAEQRYEYATKQVWKSGSSYFWGCQNGGTQGARQPNGGAPWDFWTEGPMEISKNEALAMCSEMGVEEVAL